MCLIIFGLGQELLQNNPAVALVLSHFCLIEYQIPLDNVQRTCVSGLCTNTLQWNEMLVWLLNERKCKACCKKKKTQKTYVCFLAHVLLESFSVSCIHCHEMLCMNLLYTWLCVCLL